MHACIHAYIHAYIHVHVHVHVHVHIHACMHAYHSYIQTQTHLYIHAYHLVIKHGLLEHPSFLMEMFQPAMFDYQLGTIVKKKGIPICVHQIPIFCPNKPLNTGG